MLFLKRMLFCAVLLLAGTITARAQTSTPPFPTVAKVDLLPFDDISFFSNDVHYYQTLAVGNIVGDTGTDRNFLLSLGSSWTSAGWSPNNNYLAFMKWYSPCTATTGEGNFFLFHTQDTTISQSCVPIESEVPGDLQWSPFDNNLLAILYPNLLFNVATQELTPFTFPSEIQPDRLADYVGYDRYLWDPVTQLPVAEVRLNEVINFEAHADGLIEHSTLEACGVQCIPLVDTLSISNVNVGGWVLQEHWLLWLGHWSNTGLPTRVRSAASVADSAVYLTYLPTSTTQELFRFSSVNPNDLTIPELNWSPREPRLVGLSWSPDAAVIALSLTSADPLDETDPLPTLVPGIQRPLLRGTLLLYLNWPAEAN